MPPTPSPEQIAELKERTQFREFIAVLKLGSGRTLVNAGFLILETNESQAQIVIKNVPFSGRFSLAEMKQIRNWVLKKEGTPVPPYAEVIPVDHILSTAELISGIHRHVLMGLCLFGAYTNTSLHKYHPGLNDKLDPVIFASSFHVFYSDTFGGSLKTSIEVLELGNKDGRPVLIDLVMNNGGMLRVCLKDDQTYDIQADNCVFCDADTFNQIATAKSYLRILSTHNMLFNTVTNALIRQNATAKPLTKGKKKK